MFKLFENLSCAQNDPDRFRIEDSLSHGSVMQPNSEHENPVEEAVTVNDFLSLENII